MRQDTGPLSCSLIAHSLSGHLQQLYTGFSILHNRGLIKVVQETRKEQYHDYKKPVHLRNARHAHLRLVLNQNIRVHYDTHDSWEVDEDFLSESDLYFKRSYAPEFLSTLGHQVHKIHPLGLNYLVLPDGFDRFALARALALGAVKEKLRELAQQMPFLDPVRFVARQRYLEKLPDERKAPRVVFMARAWAPVSSKSHRQDRVEERLSINEIRAQTIRLLRQELGSEFCGGFIRSKFAEAHYPDLVLSQDIESSKGRYLERVRASPICIATTGLHGSIGWKFAEYVALSRAIVSERLNYSVPGRLEEGVNYLEFASPQECVLQVQRLVEDRHLRLRMMIENARYYQKYLRPDSLVLNTILTALRYRSEHH